MLEPEQTNHLIALAKGGDNTAKEKLIAENSNLIKSIVKRYLGKGVEYDDLYQLASFGLLKAINGFDTTYGVRFSTYAVPMISGEIKRFMRDDGSIKVSRTIKATAKEINKFIQSQTAEKGDAPTVKDVAKQFKMDESEVVFILGSTHMPISLYAQGDYKDDKTQELIERIPSSDDDDDVIDKILLKSAIACLDERDKKVIMLRYFRDMTQSEVATHLGVSQVQVSRIENRIMQTFRRQLTG